MVGYRIRNQESLNSEYICPYCRLLLRDPVQIIYCGHRLCLSCVEGQKGDVIICSECYENISQENLKRDRGFRNDMQTISILCSLCDWNGILKNYEDHLNQIHPNPICTYCDEHLPTVHDLNQHQLYICEKITICCPLKELGCQAMILRSALPGHYRSKEHQKSIMNAVLHLKSIKYSTNRSHTTANDSVHLQEIDQTVNILSDGVTVLNEDRERLGKESVDQQRALDSFGTDFSKLKTSVQEQTVIIDGMRTNQDIVQQDLELMKEKVIDMKTRLYDGTLLWKIVDVKQKTAAARSNNQTSIYSPAFYSSPFGYKICLRLYLNGDGNAQGTHMSLFIVIMRSEFDAILKYPFDFKVIFCLFDQTNQKQHIIDAFIPDAKSNSFQRPRSDMNVGGGITKFAPLKLFERDNNPYIRDDTMFIKAMIDFGNIPKNIFQYVFSLNPALTNPIQQEMIQMESEKQQQQQQQSLISVSNAEIN